MDGLGVVLPGDGTNRAAQGLILLRLRRREIGALDKA